MSEFDTVEEPVGDETDPEEHQPDEPDIVVSPDTGTVYDEQGEAELTPQDLVSDEDEE
jgi:hypothetical protein